MTVNGEKLSPVDGIKEPKRLGVNKLVKVTRYVADPTQFAKGFGFLKVNRRRFFIFLIPGDVLNWVDLLDFPTADAEAIAKTERVNTVWSFMRAIVMFFEEWWIWVRKIERSLEGWKSPFRNENDS